MSSQTRRNKKKGDHNRAGGHVAHMAHGSTVPAGYQAVTACCSRAYLRYTHKIIISQHPARAQKAGSCTCAISQPWCSSRGLYGSAAKSTGGSSTCAITHPRDLCTMIQASGHQQPCGPLPKLEQARALSPTLECPPAS